MNRLLKTLIKYRYITVFFVLVLAGAGILSFISLPKQETPEFSIPYAMITTVYPGASQTDMDILVTEPIIETVRGIDGYETSSSYSSNSLSLIIVELEFSADRDESFSQLEARLRELQASLPDGCGNIDLNRNITDTAGVMLSLSSEDAGPDGLSAQAEKIIKELSEVEGFSRFEIIGEKEEQIIITIDMQKMMSAGLSITEISNIVAAGNLDIPVGKLADGEKVLAVDYTGSYKSIDDIADLAVGFSQELGRIIRLSDIADISGVDKASATRYYNNGTEAIIISGYFDEGINTLPLNKEIDEKVETITNELPEGMEISLIISQPGEIKDSLSSFSINLLVAIGLVILVVLIGMGFRNALVVSISIPFSILLTFLVMYIFNIRVQQISIAALIMSLGMLVDNSIVVSDAIQGELDRGIKRKKACLTGTGDVAVPVFASTITTIAAFAPFLFLNSLAGDYIKSLPKIISISLAASYVTAIFVIPVIGNIMFKKRKKSSRVREAKLFPGLLKWAMKRKAVVSIIILGLIAGSGYIAINLDKEFFPASDKNIVYIDIKNNSGDNIEGTETIVREITDVIKSEKEVVEYTSSVGGGLPRFNQIMYIYTSTPEIGQIMIRTDLKDSEFKSNGDFKDYLQGKLDALELDAKVTVKQLMYAFPMDEDIRINIKGENIENLKITESQIVEILAKTEGVRNINKGNTDFKEIFELEINEDKAASNFLLPAEALNEISMAVRGREAAVFIQNGKEIPVYVTGSISSSSELAGFMIKTGSGQYIDAGQILVLNKDEQMETIPRSDGTYSLSVTAYYESDFDSGQVLDEIKKSIDNLNLNDATIVYDGEDELIKENFSQVFVMGGIALAFVFMILLVQFKSFGLPLLIFLTIPLSAIGSVTGLYISGLPVSFTALLGIVSLLGIVVNNAIILIDYIKKDMDKGKNAENACINAARRRLRPILLSTITTVIGLVPLVIGTSQLFKPMAIALMSGLMVSTILTLVIIPMAASVILKHKKG